MDKDLLQTYRYFLKDSIRKRINFRFTDQNQGVPVPPSEKQVPENSTLINLPKREEWIGIPEKDIEFIRPNLFPLRSWRIFSGQHKGSEGKHQRIMLLEMSHQPDAGTHWRPIWRF